MPEIDRFRWLTKGSRCKTRYPLGVYPPYTPSPYAKGRRLTVPDSKQVSLDEIPPQRAGARDLRTRDLGDARTQGIEADRVRDACFDVENLRIIDRAADLAQQVAIGLFNPTA